MGGTYGLSGAMTQNHEGFRGTLGLLKENRACGGGARDTSKECPTADVMILMARIVPFPFASLQTVPW